jgi:hypothetical protein
VDVNPGDEAVTPLTRRQRIEELDALLDGRLAPEDAAASTRRLASVATTVVEHDPLPALTLGDERKAALRARLLADIAASPAPVGDRAREALAPRVRRAANQARVAVASTVAATMVGTTGVAVAAQEALPGDALYGIKKATESLRLSLAGDQAATARLELRFAEERLEEVVEGSQDRRVASDEDLIGTLTEMDRRSLSGAEQLIDAAEREDRPELIEEVASFADRQAETLVTAYADLPVAVKPHAEESLSVLRRIRVELLMPAIERCDCVELAGSSGRLPGDAVPRELAWFRSAAVPPAASSAPAIDALVPTPRATPDDRDSSAPDEATGATSTATDRGAASDEPSSVIGGAVDDGTSAVERTVPDTTSSVSRTVEDTASTVGRTVRGTTSESTTGSAVEDAVDDATGAVGGAVSDVTGGGTSSGTVGGASGDVGDVVGGAQDALDDATGSVGDLLP